MTPQKWLQNFMQPLIFRYTKWHDPLPICTSPPPPLINDRSLIYTSKRSNKRSEAALRELGTTREKLRAPLQLTIRALFLLIKYMYSFFSLHFHYYFSFQFTRKYHKHRKKKKRSQVFLRFPLFIQIEITTLDLANFKAWSGTKRRCWQARK